MVWCLDLGVLVVLCLFYLVLVGFGCRVCCLFGLRFVLATLDLLLWWCLYWWFGSYMDCLCLGGVFGVTCVWVFAFELIVCVGVLVVVCCYLFVCDC